MKQLNSLDTCSDPARKMNVFNEKQLLLQLVSQARYHTVTTDRFCDIQVLSAHFILYVLQAVTLHTDLGDIKIELFCERTPKTAEVSQQTISLAILLLVYGLLKS